MISAHSSSFAVFLFLFLSTYSFCQTDEEVQVIADYTCTCLTEKESQLRNISSDEMQMELGICMITAMNEAGVEVDYADPAGMEKLGERVGFQMAFSCPDFMNMIGEMMNNDPELLNDMTGSDKDNGFGRHRSIGTFVAVEESDFVRITLESDSGRKEAYYWMEHFDGANLLDNNANALKNKRISVTYEKRESYSPRLGDYIQIRVLRSLEILD
jgi:hypothetical protein